jgi:HD-GYP domain-containing protein (c-di-GMP phosphodiesterase class II)
MMEPSSLVEGRAPGAADAAGTRYREEVDALSWLLDEVRNGNALPVLEAKAVAHSLYMANRLDGKTRFELLPLREMKEYGAVHALNVSMLAMATAEQLGYTANTILEIGLAGLLMDIGMVRVPVEVIGKSEQISASERELIRRHPIEGARIIVEAESSLELAAVVAYEHHIRVDGGGYPMLRYPRLPHRITRLAQVCDSYHALSSPRPFRERWPDDIIFSFFNQKTGSDFDAEMVSALIAVLKRNTTAGRH